MSEKARKQSIIEMRKIRKEILVEKATEYFYTVDMVNGTVNVPPFIQAQRFVEWLDSNNRIGCYGNLKRVGE